MHCMAVIVKAYLRRVNLFFYIILLIKTVMCDPLIALGFNGTKCVTLVFYKTD